MKKARGKGEQEVKKFTVIKYIFSKFKRKMSKKPTGRLRNECTSGLDKVKEWPEQYLNSN